MGGKPRQLPVDLEDVCIALETTPGDMRWFLDAKTGEAILITDEYDPAESEGSSRDEIEAHPDRYLLIPQADSARAFREMEDFISSLDDVRLKESLQIALGAPKPFRRFKNVLEQVPEQRQRWFDFKRDRTEARARQWLADNGIEPVAHRRRSS